ncbi:MAG: RNA polymerase subunit sigma [Acidobacteria bacterium]|nr:MAG: RNA polymerase subunit sigma [Acidobacteriota bacterium]REK09611.1 MAG: RNA polymerase subunit sigma [Acidobacteriota bacterium]
MRIVPDPPRPSDRDAAARGDDASAQAERRRAFEEEALPHLRRVWAQARRLEFDPAAAEDLVQETFLRAYRTFDNFERGTNAVAWLLTILHSIHSNRRRRQWRETPGEDDQHLEKLSDRAALETDWDALFHRSVREGSWGAGRAIRRALSELPEGFREVVLLVDVAELTYEEAAAALSCPVGTVRSRLARARRRLAADLAHCAEELGLRTGARVEAGR